MDHMDRQRPHHRITTYIGDAVVDVVVETFPVLARTLGHVLPWAALFLLLGWVR